MTSDEVLSTTNSRNTEQWNAPIARGQIEDFLSRPVVIINTSWTSTPFVLTKYDPWSLLLSNTALRSKIAGFARFKADIRVRIAVSATPFHYGKLMLSYEPCLAGGTGYSADYGSPTYRSQLQHVMLDASESTVAEMLLPYVSWRPYIPLTDGSTSASQVGVLLLEAMNDLQMINAATPTSVNIIAYAWFENVCLEVPTSTATNTFTAQMKTTHSKSKGKKEPMGLAKPSKTSAPAKDEHSQGSLSRIATAVSAAAGALKDVPIIGSWAQSASIGAGLASKVFSIFGYSKAVDLTEPMRVKVQQFDQMCHTTGLDMSQKFTLDPKAALAIGNAAIGADFGDELSISSMASRESYISTTAWATTAATDTVLITMPVSPVFCNYAAVTGGTRYTPSALAYVASVFNYWTGSIKYRLEIVGAALHTGKLRIVYVPDSGAYVSGSTNTTFSQVIDISETRDHCFSIGMCQSSPWLLCNFLGQSGDFGPSVTNGTFYVVVLNELGSILSTQGVSINLWIAGGEDFQVAYPSIFSLANENVVFLKPQMKTTNTVMPGEDPVNDCESEDLALVPSTEYKNLNLAYFGEAIASFRALLKRSSYYYTYCDKTVATANVVNVCAYGLPAFPMQPGYNSLYGLNTTSLAAKYTYTQHGFLTYLAPAFLGWKGSLRWKINSSDPMIASQCVGKYFVAPSNIINVSANGFATAKRSITTSTSRSTSVYNYNAELLTLTDAVVMGTTMSETGLEIETDPYLPTLYQPYSIVTNGGSATDGPHGITVTKFYSDSAAATGADDYNLYLSDNVFVSASDDFNFVYFKAAPTLWFTTRPAPSATV